jgi:hypothetical protein
MITLRQHLPVCSAPSAQGRPSSMVGGGFVPSDRTRAIPFATNPEVTR